MSHHKLDTLYLMRLLVAIVRCGSFAAAAAQLGITPSKASKICATWSRASAACS